MILGKCPFCEGEVLSIKTVAQGKKVKLYTCENAKKEHDDSEQFVFTADSTCTFRVYSNTFLRWNKRSFGENEMRTLLNDGQVTIRLHGRKGTGEYFKYVIPSLDYGVSILWDEDVEVQNSQGDD